MPKEFTITRSETHYVTYNVSYHVTAENQEEAETEVEKYWGGMESTAEIVSYYKESDFFNEDSYASGEITEIEELTAAEESEVQP